MNNINLKDLISYIVLGAGVVSFLASVMMKYDKKHANLWSDIHNIADAVVAQQAIRNVSNSDKKSDATKELMNQAQKLGHDKITEEVAKGAIEQAVSRAKDQPVVEIEADSTPATPEVKPAPSPLDDLHL